MRTPFKNIEFALGLTALVMLAGIALQAFALPAHFV